MSIVPSNSRWPQRIPDAQQGYFYVDNRNLGAGDKFDRRGPYRCDLIPADGQLQVPQTSKSGDVTMVMVDARIWLPVESGAAARSVITNVTTNVSYSVVYVPRWSPRIEAFVVRRTPS